GDRLFSLESKAEDLRYQFKLLHDSGWPATLVAKRPEGYTAHDGVADFHRYREVGFVTCRAISLPVLGGLGRQLVKARELKYLPRQDRRCSPWGHVTDVGEPRCPREIRTCPLM